MNTLWSIVRDVSAIKPGDTVFFYEMGHKLIHGVFEVTSEPFICADTLYGDPQEQFPFRFAFRKKLNFPRPMPDFEFIHLVDRKVIWSISSLQHDPTGPFRSIVNLSAPESAALQRVLVKYNTQADPLDVPSYSPPSISAGVEVCDIIDSLAPWPATPTAIEVNRLPAVGFRSSYVSRYEFALQAYFGYMLGRRSAMARSLFGAYSDSLTEVPLSAAEPRRIDVLCAYSAVGSQEPFFYQIVELKRRDLISAVDLNQLVGYMRIFSQKKGVEIGDVGGTYVGRDFDLEAVSYVKQRAKIEVEKPITLTKYTLSPDGQVSFEQIA